MSEVRREGYKFCQDICVPCYDTDASFYLKPASFMDMAQEIAYWAAQELVQVTRRLPSASRRKKSRR